MTGLRRCPSAGSAGLKSASSDLVYQSNSIASGLPPKSPEDGASDADAAEKGRKIVSANGGFSCVSCHGVADFGATQVFEAPGINLALSHERLQRSFFNRWLRSPLSVDPTTKMPVYFDELAHWRQVEHMVATGRILQDNVVVILRDYPGLHALTTALERATGLSTWTLGTVLLVSLRVVVPVLAATVARAAGLSPRAADLAGLVYALNPGFMFFTGMYAYESLAIVLQLAAVGLLGMVVAGSRPSAGAARRLSVLLTFAVALTHHLTSLMFLLMVFALLVLHRGRIARRDLRRQESRRRVARLGVTLIGVVLIVTILASMVGALYFQARRS